MGFPRPAFRKMFWVPSRPMGPKPIDLAYLASTFLGLRSLPPPRLSQQLGGPGTRPALTGQKSDGKLLFFGT